MIAEKRFFSLLFLQPSKQSDFSCFVQGALSVPHLLVCQVFEELLHMAAPSEGGQSYCEGVQDELGDTLMRTVNIISSFFEMLDLDKNGNVELADLHRMQVSDSALYNRSRFSLQCCIAAACTRLRPYVCNK